jgi:hypothetical protein
MSFKTNKSAVCPRCGGGAGGATNLAGDTHPRDGDFAICFYCGGLNVYRADLTLRGPTPKEGREFTSLVGEIAARTVKM